MRTNATGSAAGYRYGGAPGMSIYGFTILLLDKVPAARFPITYLRHIAYQKLRFRGAVAGPALLPRPGFAVSAGPLHLLGV